MRKLGEKQNEEMRLKKDRRNSGQNALKDWYSK